MSKEVEELKGWMDVMVDVVREYGKPMKQDAAQRLTAKICRVSIERMPYVTTNCVADGLLKRGSLGKWDILSLPEW